MLQLKSDRKLLNLNGYTVIIPSVCVGNAGQLACDLLISWKKLRRIGTIHHPALIPIFGPSAYQHEPNETVSACELYESNKEQLLVIQFRTPFISTHVVDFNEKLVEIIKKAQRVIILTGSFSFEKHFVGDTAYEYKASDSFIQLYDDKLKRMRWKIFQGQTIFGGGNALQLFKVLEKHQVPVMLLFRYLLEGDNSMDATLIMKELNDLCENFLSLKGDKETEINDLTQLTIPISWKLLFGNDATELIF